MTSNTHDDLNNIIKLLTNKSNIINPLLSDYHDRSRYTNVLNNINLFLFDTKNSISINPIFEKRMDEFLEQNLSIFLQDKLRDNDAYKEFLYNDQGWSLDLINQDNQIPKLETQESDADYVDGSVDIEDITVDEIIDNSKTQPSH